MDWPRAINRNREALQRIIAALFALAGFTVPGPSSRSIGEGAAAGLNLPRPILAAILLVLRPAESAVRRLILIAALCAKAGSRPIAVRAEDSASLARLQALPRLSHAFRTPAFTLFDTLKSFDPDEIWNVDPAAQIRFQSGFDTGPDPTSGFRALPDQQRHVPALPIIQRLFAVGHALETLPAQARRLLRWQTKRDALLKARRPTRLSPLRPGLPPGWRQRRLHEIDDVLKECHGLVLDRLESG